jgi:hypothetical protein
MANAVGNVARGAGTENMENYRNCKKNYMGIDNIHVMRDSLARMCDGKLHLSCFLIAGVYHLLIWDALIATQLCKDRNL